MDFFYQLPYVIRSSGVADWAKAKGQVTLCHIFLPLAGAHAHKCIHAEQYTNESPGLFYGSIKNLSYHNLEL